jgi:hypothetical protein
MKYLALNHFMTLENTLKMFLLNFFPTWLPKKEASAVKKIIRYSIGGKETKQTFDYQCVLIILAKSNLQRLFLHY